MRVDPKLIDVFPDEHDGYPVEFEAQDTIDVLRAMGARDFPQSWWIEPREWVERAKYNDAKGLWPRDFANRFTNQSPTHECTCHSLTQQFEMCWNAQRAGKGSPVYVSPISIYAEANPRQWGGANIQTVLGICQARGFLPEHAGPNGIDEQRRLFKHTLPGTCGKGNAHNSSGNWVKLSQFPDGWERSGRCLRALECINIEMWEQMVCIVLNSRGVGVGRKGHAVPYDKWHWEDEVMGYRDSYDRFLADSKSTMRSAVGGAHAIVSVTMPNDWAFPLEDEYL